MILNYCCMLILSFYVLDKKKKDVDCNVAVNWVMLFIYGIGHLMHLFSPRSHFLTHTHGDYGPNTTVRVYNAVPE